MKGRRSWTRSWNLVSFSLLHSLGRPSAMILFLWQHLLVINWEWSTTQETFIWKGKRAEMEGIESICLSSARSKWLLSGSVDQAPVLMTGGSECQQESSVPIRPRPISVRRSIPQRLCSYLGKWKMKHHRMPERSCFLIPQKLPPPPGNRWWGQPAKVFSYSFSCSQGGKIQIFKLWTTVRQHEYATFRQYTVSAWISAIYFEHQLLDLDSNVFRLFGRNCSRQGRGLAVAMVSFTPRFIPARIIYSCLLAYWNWVFNLILNIH